jgi:hypothetical protein
VYGNSSLLFTDQGVLHRGLLEEKGWVFGLDRFVHP